MLFETHQLKGPLSTYIESIFHFKDFIPDHSIERVVPTGHLFLIFELDDFERCTFDNETLEVNSTFTKVWISGMHKHHLSISAHANSEMFVIQFKPFGAYPFFHFPIHKLNDQVVPAEQILDEEILDLRQELLKAVGPIEKFKQAESWLLSRFEKDKTPPQELLDVLEKLSVESVSHFPRIVMEYGKTQKHLIEQFKKYVGLTPKYFQRVLRFNEILQNIHKNEAIEWPQVAYQCEYSDQSHFIKEFKHFSGFNPQKFIKHDFHQEPPNFFPLDRQG